MKKRPLHSAGDEKGQMSSDERSIRELVDQWMDASKRGDIEAALGLMSEDIIFMVPGQEPFGRETFTEMLQSMTGAEVDGRAEICELKLLGDWAWIRNHIEITIKPLGRGEPILRSGYAL